MAVLRRQNGDSRSWAVTTMPNPSLPEELLDYIVDFLHDQERPLKNCCLVSKSWIPRTRRHLFAYVFFWSGAELESWMKTFPDSYTSPASYTRSLRVDCPRDAANLAGGCWILAFSLVVHFQWTGFETPYTETLLFLAPFQGFSPVLETLHLHLTTIPPSFIFDFILSFPLLRNLTIKSYDTPPDYLEDGHPIPPLHPIIIPPFTGCLDIRLNIETDPITSRLMSLPGGLRFRRLRLRWGSGDNAPSTTALVESCCSTLESLFIECAHVGIPVLHLSVYQRLIISYRTTRL